MGHIKTNQTLHLTEILAYLKSFNNYIYSTEDKPSQTSSFFRNSWFLGLNSIISLQHLPRTTLFKLICRVYAVNRFSKHRCGTTCACMEFHGLYGIYRLALSQSNFLRPGLYELVINNDLNRLSWTEYEVREEINHITHIHSCKPVLRSLFPRWPRSHKYVNVKTNLCFFIVLCSGIHMQSLRQFHFWIQIEHSWYSLPSSVSPCFRTVNF